MSDTSPLDQPAQTQSGLRVGRFLVRLPERLHRSNWVMQWPTLPCFALWFSLLFSLTFAAPARAQTLLLNWAIAAQGDGATYPTTAPSREVSLPDEWALTRPGQSGPVWYRSAFIIHPDDASDALRAIYVAQVCTNLEMQLNGRLIFSGGNMRGPVTHNCNLPLLVNLPAGLLARGVNTLDIQVVGSRQAEVGSRQRAANLGVIEIGPQHELAHRHSMQTALQVTAPQAVSATLLLMGCFLFVMGFMQRQDSHLAYFGALCVGWGLISARLWWHDLPLRAAASEFLLLSLLPFVTLAGVQFLLRFANKRVHWVNLALPAQCALMPLSLIVAGPSRLQLMAWVWYAVLTFEVSWSAALCARHGRQVRQPSSYWLLMATLATLALAGAVTVAGQWRLLPNLPAHVAQLLPPFMFVLLGLSLMQQHGRALIAAEKDKAVLEQRVREATAEIERNFEQMSDLKVEQVTERERKRIAADLHDDLGAKLLTIVHTSESERISTLAREALEEMRLSVRGLTGKAVQLADALGDWRAEVVSRLGQAGIEADWTAPDDLPQRLSARAYVQTTRILREVTSNIIKHSGASRCTVTCEVANGDFSLVVQDNGNGISADIEARIDRGHGLASMKHRAKQLQGQCLVESGPGYGTVIRLTLPMDRAVQDA